MTPEYHDMTQPACERCYICAVCSRWYHGGSCPCQQATVDATETATDRRTGDRRRAERRQSIISGTPERRALRLTRDEQTACLAALSLALYAASELDDSAAYAAMQSAHAKIAGRMGTS